MKKLGKERDEAYEKANIYKTKYRKLNEENQSYENKIQKYESLLINKDNFIKEVEENNEALKFGIDQLRKENEQLISILKHEVILSYYNITFRIQKNINSQMHIPKMRNKLKKDMKLITRLNINTTRKIIHNDIQN